MFQLEEKTKLENYNMLLDEQTHALSQRNIQLENDSNQLTKENDALKHKVNTILFFFILANIVKIRRKYFSKNYSNL